MLWRKLIVCQHLITWHTCKATQQCYCYTLCAVPKSCSWLLEWRPTFLALDQWQTQFSHALFINSLLELLMTVVEIQNKSQVMAPQPRLCTKIHQGQEMHCSVTIWSHFQKLRWGFFFFFFTSLRQFHNLINHKCVEILLKLTKVIALSVIRCFL